MTDIKTWMDDKQRIHNISNYNIFRVTMENGVVVLDVKHLSTSEIWVRLDNILTTLPTAEIKLVTPKYDDVDRFQEKLTEMIEKYMMTDHAAAIWRQHVDEIKRNDNTPQWSFNLPTYQEREKMAPVVLETNINDIEVPASFSQSTGQQLYMTRLCYFSKRFQFVLARWCAT